MNLNIPETRQHILERRLAAGAQIVAADAALEFGVSLDTVRRDILALEQAGRAHRVRGGAVPVIAPQAPLHERLSPPGGDPAALVSAALDEVGAAMTLMLDGGATVLAFARALPALPGRLVITPSPRVAIACQANALEVFMIGGRLSGQGGVNVGEASIDRLSRLAADVAVLGACGLAPEFGLSSDDPDESGLKRALHAAARRTVVIAPATKVGKRARHQTLLVDQIDRIVTDAPSSEAGRFPPEILRRV